MGKAPSLAVVNEAFGKGTVQSWLALQLHDLSEFSGAREKLTVSKIDDITEVIISQFSYLKVTELMHFFLLFKGGKFGKFYGAVDGLAIMESLRDFADERKKMVLRWRQEEESMAAAARAANDELQYSNLRQRYIERIPDAFSDKAPIDFLQYRLMGFDVMDDERLAREIDAVCSGKKKLPTAAIEMIRGAFRIE